MPPGDDVFEAGVGEDIVVAGTLTGTVEARPEDREISC
jgi:hypothetical protein